MSTQEKSSVEKNVASVVTLKEAAISAPKKPASAAQFATWIHALLNNWRQGTVGAKGRADVARSGKKPWKQKGTGRARAGTSRSPLWRGGGVIFGPEMKTKKLRVNKQLKKQVLATMAADFIKAKKVRMLNWELPEGKPKTKHAVQLLDEIGLRDKHVVLFVSSGDTATYASFMNIPRAQVVLFDQPNAFDLAHADSWLYLKKDHDAFKEMVGKWQS